MKTQAGGEGGWVMARLGVGFILAYAGFSKLIEPIGNFEAVLSRYEIFRPSWLPIVAGTVPWLEWFVGAFLFLGYLPRGSSIGAALLSLGFLVTLGSSDLLLKAGGTDCGCFGQAGLLHLSVRQIFMIDLVNFALALRMSFQTHHSFSLESLLLKKNRP